MPMEINILDKKIDENSPVLIIAEAGVCHDGDIKKAKKLVDIAKEAGVDIVKFQTWITEELCLPETKKAEYQKEQTGENESQFEMIKKLELSYEEFSELKKYCDKKKMIFMSTPDEEKSANFLINDLNMCAIKIGSGELTNHQYINFLASFNKPTIVSTGMSRIGEIKKAKDIIFNKGNKNVIFLHCTTDYPTKYEDVNLNAMLTMKKNLNTLVGYSDHTEGIYVSLVAIALGATVIEKHFTYDRHAFGPDHRASLSPTELKEMIQEIRNLEKLPKEQRITYVKKRIGERLFDLIAGSFDKKPTERETKNRPIVQKSIVARKNLPVGTILQEKDLIMKRADARGISADKYETIIGKEIKKNIEQNRIITFEDLK
jgi:N,N'-diacetyllegionaminate synthase